MTDILERAKAVDPEMLAVLNWGALRDLISELIAEVEAKQANNEYLQKMTEEAQGIMQESQLLLCKEANEAEQLQNEVERLRSVISEPVKSFGTMELVSWVNQLQKTISEYPDAEWGNWPFVLMMGVHCENFSKRWHSPTIELMAARIKELEAEVERLRSIEAQQLIALESTASIVEHQAARIKELEAELENLNGMGTVEYMLGYKKGGDGNKVLIDYIKRLEAAFLEATKEIVYAIHEGRDAPEGEDVYAEKEAREALEELRHG